MDSVEDLTGFNYPRIRALAREYAAATEPARDAANALPYLDAPDEENRMLAVWLVGYTAAARPDHLTLLHTRRPRSKLASAGAAGAGVRHVLRGAWLRGRQSSD